MQGFSKNKYIHIFKSLNESKDPKVGSQNEKKKNNTGKRKQKDQF